jgi:hypothetical protein
MKITLRLSTLALLALVSLSLVGCDKGSQSGTSSSQEPQNVEPIVAPKSEPQPTPTETPSPKPSIDPYYGDGPGGKFYNH